MKRKVWKSLLGVLALVVLTVSGVGAYTLARYFKTSPRFEVARVPIAGLKRVEKAQVRARAGLPDAVNVFSVDLNSVRERIEQLKWVRYATVQRILPNTISIQIVERQPVGLARIRGELFQFDAQAELLEPERGGGVNFPILDGLRAEDSNANLNKVGLYLRVMDELHGQNELSEVHINDIGEVSVISLSEPLLVNLGQDEFKERWERYLQLRAQIQRDYPEAVQVDFRFKDQVILKTNADAPDEQKVVWDVEKKSL
jgi:cell division protein FtsQ